MWEATLTRSFLLPSKSVVGNVSAVAPDDDASFSRCVKLLARKQSVVCVVRKKIMIIDQTDQEDHDCTRKAPQTDDRQPPDRLFCVPLS